MLITLLIACSSNGTVAPPGDPARFDPVASYAEVAKFAGEGFQLTSMQVLGLRSDGTIDLTQEAIRGSVSLEGFHEIPAPPDAPPVGAGGSLDGHYWETVTLRIYQPGQLRNVSTNGSNWSYRHRGMERTGSPQPARPSSEVLVPPRCKLDELFRGLIEQGAPESAVAMARYEASGWKLDVRDTAFTARFDAGCQRVK